MRTNSEGIVPRETTFEFKNIMFYVNYAQTELLLKWSSDEESKETQEAYKKLYYDCKQMKETLSKRLFE